jgi:phosphohistidine swiveling domain-containing protein
MYCTTSIIAGTGWVPGQNNGITRKIESIEEADAITDGHVVLFTKAMQLTGTYVMTLLSLMLRVRDVVIQHGPTWMHHIGQIARECGVPIVQISPADMARIPEGSELVVDGSAGTVTIQYSVEKTG